MRNEIQGKIRGDGQVRHTVVKLLRNICFKINYFLGHQDVVHCHLDLCHLLATIPALQYSPGDLPLHKQVCMISCYWNVRICDDVCCIIHEVCMMTQVQVYQCYLVRLSFVCHEQLMLQSIHLRLVWSKYFLVFPCISLYLIDWHEILRLFFQEKFKAEFRKRFNLCCFWIKPTTNQSRGPTSDATQSRERFQLLVLNNDSGSVSLSQTASGNEYKSNTDPNIMLANAQVLRNNFSVVVNHSFRD